MRKEIGNRVVREKAFAYVIRGNALLVFRHTEYPEVGVQVPGGTVTPGEHPSDTALREAAEETGLTHLRVVASLGQQVYDMLPLKDEIHVRHFFHLSCDVETPAQWVHCESHPDSSEVLRPIQLEFAWQELDGTDAGLVVGQGALLPRLAQWSVNAPRSLHRRSFVADLAAPIQAARNQKLQAMREAFRALQPEYVREERWDAKDPAQYAGLHHIFYTIVKAAGAKDSVRTRYMLSSLQAWLAGEHAEAPMVVPHARCLTQDDKRFDSPLFIWQPDQEAIDGEQRLRVVRALTLLNRLHYGELIEGTLGLVVLMQQRARAEPTKSFTISALPGTVFIDDVDDEVRLAELLLHESSHAWLNDALAAVGESIPLTTRFWSPWKQTMRPAYGIIQAAFAFSQMMQFFADMLDRPGLSSYARAYCSQRLEADTEAMCQGLPQLVEAAKLLKNRLIRGLILDEANRALQDHGRGVG